MKKSKIQSLEAREISDSRENPTIEVEIRTESGLFRASVPSGASTGKYEALEFRDEDGKGVLRAIKKINEIIAPKIEGKDAGNQKEIDGLMIALDGTQNKSNLGANSILAVSLAVCRSGAGSRKTPLYLHIAELSENKNKLGIPRAMFNILNGGAHARNKLDIQEFMVVPQKKTFAENLVVCNKIFQNLKELINKNYKSEDMGDEGGFAPPISKTEQALYLLKNAISDNESKIALDCAASQFFKEGKYILEGQELTKNGLLDFYKNLIKSFPIISIEDPFSEEDWQGFEMITQNMGKEITIVGDDLTVTNISKIREAHNKTACNGVILKPNQIGTVSETIEAATLARSFGFKTIVSHRSGETMDDFIADLAVGLSADFLKAGSPAKPERMVKYARLLEIEQELKKHG